MLYIIEEKVKLMLPIRRVILTLKTRIHSKYEKKYKNLQIFLKKFILEPLFINPTNTIKKSKKEQKSRELNTKQRLMEIIREGSDLIWADVRNAFFIQSRIRLWWPGRVLSRYLVFLQVLSDSEVNLLDPQDRELPIQLERDFPYVELFGFRRNCRYYPYLLLPSSFLQGTSPEKLSYALLW